MNKLNDLIKELCPNGVRYEKIGDIGKVCMCKRIMKNQTRPTGDIPFYKIGTFGGKADAYISNELFDEYSTKYSYPKKNEILISCSGTIGRTVIFNGEKSYFQDSNIVWVSNDEQKVLNKFLYYFYQTFPWKIYDGGVIKRLYNNIIEQTAVPVPPLEVQCEIVHILDNFTLLSAELSAELKARQMQYNYYKDNLFLTLNNTKKYKLNEISQIYDGTHQTPKYTDKGISFISVENINNIYESKKYISEEEYNKYKVKPKVNDIFMTRIGSIGKCAVFNKEQDLAYYVSLALIRPNTDIVNSYYLKYLIESIIGIKELRKRTLVNAVPIKINKEDIGKLEFPIPNIEEQIRIVNILNKFDKICNDICSGLPAEIEARQKQYEYYRDKLLNFKELKEE